MFPLQQVMGQVRTKSHKTSFFSENYTHSLFVHRIVLFFIKSEIYMQPNWNQYLHQCIDLQVECYPIVLYWQDNIFVFIQQTHSIFNLDFTTIHSNNMEPEFFFYLQHSTFLCEITLLEIKKCLDELKKNARNYKNIFQKIS